MKTKFKPIVWITAAALAVGGVGYGTYKKYVPPSQNPSVWLASTGTDATCVRGNSALKCKTFQKAFTIAQAGDIVEISAGSYGGETLTGDKGSAADVVFQPASGATVTVTGSRMTLSDLHHVTLKGITFSTSDTFRDVMFEACNSDLTLDGATAKKFTMLEGNTDVTIKNSSFGGYGTSGDTVDNVIGTAGATGPVRMCGGSLAGPATNILIDNVRFHDVFWGVAQADWGGAHPDCFEINGYVNGVTIQNSEFDHCVDSFMGLYTDQGDLINVTFTNNDLHDGGTPSFYAIQNVCSGSNTGSGNFAGSSGYKGGNIKFQNSTWDTNPAADESYPSLRAECAQETGFNPVEISGNTFDQGPPPTVCTTSKGSPYNSNWHDNTYLFGDAC